MLLLERRMSAVRRMPTSQRSEELRSRSGDHAQHLVSAIGPGAVGSMLAWTLDPVQMANTADYVVGITNQRLTLSAIYVPRNCTAVGVVVNVFTAGVYTATGYNGLCLYSCDGTNYNQLAQTPANGNMWKTTTQTPYPFGAPVALTAGIYWLGGIYNNSVETTPPGVFGINANFALNAPNYMDIAHFGGRNAALAATTTAPATIPVASTITVNLRHLLVLYGTSP